MRWGRISVRCVSCAKIGAICTHFTIASMLVESLMVVRPGGSDVGVEFEGVVSSILVSV